MKEADQLGESLSLDPLLQLGLGHWRAKPFLTVCELRLFTLIEAGTNTVEAVAGALSLPERGTRFLLDGMVALQLLAKESGGYQTTPLSSTFLVEGKPGYMGDFFVAVNRLYFAPFGDFELALREDRPVWSVDAQGKHVTLTGEAADLSTRAMHALNTPTGLAFGQMYNLAGRRHLLDLGGGSGAMSIGAVSHNPGLMATVLDRSGVCAVARSYIAEAGLAQRIDTLAADLFDDVYPAGPDVHLYSNVFHDCRPQECQTLLHKSYEALPASGAVVIADFVLDESRAAPTFGAVFNFLALVTMDGGEAHTYGEYSAWLEEAGFVGVGRIDLPGPTTLVFASKP